MTNLRTFAVLGALALASVFVLSPDPVQAVLVALGAGTGADPLVLIVASAAGAAVSLDDIKKAQDEFMQGFEQFKEANDANLKKRDALLEDKINKLNVHLDKFEPLNQQVTLAAEKQNAIQAQLDKIEMATNRPGLPAGAEEAEAKVYRGAFEHCLRKTADARDPQMLAAVNKRRNALVKGDDAGAGYLLAPPDVQADIIKDVIELSPMRSLATVRSIGVESLKQPRRTSAAGAARRVGEVQQRENTGDPAYGMLEIYAPEMFARAEVSQQMLEDTDYDLVAELRSEFVEQFAVKEGQEFIAGPGAKNAAEGILAAANVGEVISGEAADLTADGLINLQVALKTFYARNARFILNRASIGKVRTLKDGEGRYIWQPGLAQGVANTLLGDTYVEMPDMPNVAAGTFPIAYGDFRRAYVVVDRIGIQFQPDWTTGADNGVVVFRARKRVGGGVRQAEAFKKLKIAAT